MTTEAIREQWKRRQAWHRAEKSLTLQASAVCRRFSGGSKTKASALLKKIESGEDTSDAFAVCFPLLTARESPRRARKDAEKTLVKMVKDHPLAPFVEGIKGVAPLSLAAIIGEAGDIENYKSVAALWKRFGLAVIDGERQRKKSGLDALKHGYSPQRRSVMWNIGGGLIGCMGKGPRPLVGEDINKRNDLTEYQRLFIERLRVEVEANPEFCRDPVEKNGELRESFAAHASNRAKRYVEKRFLRDIFEEVHGPEDKAT